jgi:hypothetical protein
MNDYKKILASFIEVVTFLFASFGGFFGKIAPPDQVGAAYPVGILSFLLLILLMAISVMGRNAPRKAGRNNWLIAGILLFVLALPASFMYPYMIGHYTYPQDSELSKRRISASDEYLTSDARQYKLANPTATPEDLDQNLPDGHVWTQAGIEQAEVRLLVAYTCLVLSLSGAIFCLLEAKVRSAGDTNAPGPNTSSPT